MEALQQTVEMSRVSRLDRPVLGVYSPNGAYQYWVLSPSQNASSAYERFIDIDSERIDLQRIRLINAQGSVNAL